GLHILRPVSRSKRSSARRLIVLRVQKRKAEYGFVGGKKRFQLCFVRNSPRWTSRRRVIQDRAWAPPRNPPCQLTAGSGCPGSARRSLGQTCIVLNRGSPRR